MPKTKPIDRQNGTRPGTTDKVTLANQALLHLSETLARLATWVRPGSLAYDLAQLRLAMAPQVRALQEQQEALLSEFAVMEPDPNQPGQERRKTRPVVRGGKHVADEFVTTDPKAFALRDKELMEGTTTLTVPFRLTAAHMSRLDECRLDGDDLPSVDLIYLAPIMAH